MTRHERVLTLEPNVIAGTLGGGGAGRSMKPRLCMAQTKTQTVTSVPRVVRAGTPGLHVAWASRPHVARVWTSVPRMKWAWTPGPRVVRTWTSEPRVVGAGTSGPCVVRAGALGSRVAGR
jgi:hypothetical protein